ncbi:MAG: N-acetylmuramoyl-L-alanine amidase [Burkholderiales bacterium]
MFKFAKLVILPARARAAVFSLIFPLLHVPAAGAIEIVSARVWPAQDYTRLTIESNAPIAHNLFSIKNPERLVLDLENIELDAALENISAKIAPSDPYIRQVRVGRFKPGVVRLVFDLKAEVKPQVFVLKPVAQYAHRLVLDIYPAVDPLLALALKQDSKLGAPEPSSEKEENEAGAKPADKAESQKEPKSAETRQKTKPEAARLVTIAVDAGHGGEDPGAHGRGGTREKNVTLAIARKLKARLDDEPNMRVLLIRDGDYFIPLQGRVDKARKVQADLFISIHADAYIKSHARGSSVFALSERGATSAAAAALAKQENLSDLIGGVNLDVQDPYLKQTLFDLAQTATINDSLKLGKAVLAELGNVNTLHRQAVEQAGFAVLKSPDIPSILVETAFISNPDEEKKLKDESYQNKIADAIAGGIKRYFAKNPPLAKAKLARN